MSFLSELSAKRNLKVKSSPWGAMPWHSVIYKNHVLPIGGTWFLYVVVGQWFAHHANCPVLKSDYFEIAALRRGIDSLSSIPLR